MVYIFRFKKQEKNASYQKESLSENSSIFDNLYFICILLLNCYMLILLQKWLQFLYIFCFKSRRKTLLIMENHSQKMLLSRNATSLGAQLKKCPKACRTSWKCKNIFRGNRNRKLKATPISGLWRFWVMVALLVVVLTIISCMMPTSSVPSMSVFCNFSKFVNGSEWCRNC